MKETEAFSVFYGAIFGGLEMGYLCGYFG